MWWCYFGLQIIFSLFQTFSSYFPCSCRDWWTLLPAGQSVSTRVVGITIKMNTMKNPALNNLSRCSTSSSSVSPISSRHLKKSLCTETTPRDDLLRVPLKCSSPWWKITVLSFWWMTSKKKISSEMEEVASRYLWGGGIIARYDSWPPNLMLYTKKSHFAWKTKTAFWEFKPIYTNHI